MDGDTISWRAMEHHTHKKGADWYWALGIIAVGGAATSIIFGNALFAILILVGAVALGLNAARAAREIEFELNPKGLIVDEAFYPFASLEAFWVEDDGVSDPMLFLKSERALMPQIVVPLGDVSPEEVHEFLSEFLEEEEMAEPFSQKVAEFFGL